MLRRRGDRPFQGVRVPGVFLRYRPPDHRVEEIHDEWNLAEQQDDRENRRDYVKRLQRLQHLVRRQFVDSPRAPADSNQEQRNKDAVEGDERNPEMYLAARYT